MKQNNKKTGIYLWKLMLIIIYIFILCISIEGFLIVERKIKNLIVGNSNEYDSSIEIQENGKDGISETLNGDKAYVSYIEIPSNSNTESGKDIKTGTAPYDTENSQDDSDYTKTLVAGDDNTALNNIVRTFDTISYKVSVYTSMSDSTISGFKYGKVYFELLLPYSNEEAIFETDGMGSLLSQKEIEFKIITINNEQTGGKDWQVLKGSFLSTPNNNNEISIGNSYMTFDVVIRVLSMKNGEKMQPKFTFWLQDNDVFGGQEFDTAINNWYTDETNNSFLVTLNGSKCSIHQTQDGQELQEYQTCVPPEIMVTAVPRYNLQVVSGNQMWNQKLGVFDFNVGEKWAPNYGIGKVNGRLIGYGIVVQLVGKTKSHGLKGVELPDTSRPITFNLKLSSKYLHGENTIDVTEEYKPLLYSLEGNEPWGDKQEDGRIITANHYGCLDIPRNIRAPWNGIIDSCYNGGTWRGKVNEDNSVTITITDFKINLNELPWGILDSGKITYYNPNEINNYWEIQTGCIGAGEIWLVQPFYNSNEESDSYKKHILDQYGSGTFNVSIEDSNLHMYGIDGKNVEKQSVESDDIATTDCYLEKEGYITSHIFYKKYKGNQWNDSLADGCFDNGRDYASPKQKFTLAEWITHSAPEGKYVGTAFDSLIKWDSDFVEVEGCEIEERSPEFVQKDGIVRLLWAAKPDKTGWNHNGLKSDENGYDEEMINATADDLVFFESLEELQEKGYICLGLLLETRGVEDEGIQNEIGVHVHTTVKEDCIPGNVYMITHNNYVWNKSDLKELVSEYSGKDVSELDDNDYNNYVKSDKFPTRKNQNSKENALNYERDYPNACWVKTADTFEDIKGYIKTKYNEDGSIIGSGGNILGDSCLVVEYNVNNKITTAQTGINESGNKGEKKNYNLDLGERIVDFKISSEVTSKVEISGTENTRKTTLTLKATLCKGLKYIRNSSFWGGTYKEASVGQGSVENSAQIFAEVIENDDGTTDLIWKIPNISFELKDIVPLDNLYFSCEIINPDEIQNGTELFAKTEIRSTEDNIREISEINGNLSTTSIRVLKNNSAVLIKTADKPVIELGEDMGFTMSYENTASNPEKMVLVEGIPYNDENNKSKFNGNLYVHEFTAECGTSENTNIDTYKFYYTENEEYRNKKSIDLVDSTSEKNEDFKNTNIWKELGIKSKTGNKIYLDVPENFSPVLIVVIGDLNPRDKIKLHNIIRLPDAKRGDYITNYLSQNRLETSAMSGIVTRMIDGNVWLDSNRNGLQGTSEEKIQNLIVKLMKKADNGEYEYVKYNGEDIKIHTNQQIDILTGKTTNYEFAYPPIDLKNDENTINDEAKGYYRFYNLDKGTYKVVFLSNEGDSTKIDLSNFNVSPKDVGTDDFIDSDGLGYNFENNVIVDDINNKLNYAEITDINLEKVENLTDMYFSNRHNDLGLYRIVDFEFYKVDKDNLDNYLSGARFNLYKLTCTDKGHNHDELISKDKTDCWNLIRHDIESKSLFSRSTGRVVIEDILLNQEYRLIEIKAPIGRILPKTQWKIIIRSDNELEIGKEKILIEAIGDNFIFKYQENGTSNVGVIQNEYLSLSENTFKLTNELLILPITGGIGIEKITTIGISICIISILIKGNTKKVNVNGLRKPKRRKRKAH